MEKDPETLAPTIDVTFLPTIASSVATTFETVPPAFPDVFPATEIPSSSPSGPPTFRTASPSLAATLAPTLAIAATSVPTIQDQSPTLEVPVTTVPTIQDQSEAPTMALLPSTRDLYPFSLRIEGTLEDETTFRMDVQSYLLKSMKQVIPAIQDITLTTTPVPFGLHLRSMQQATLLAYDGIAILEKSQNPFPTSDDILLAQLTALQNSTNGGLQRYLRNDSSSSSITLLQLQVADFDPVTFDPPVVSQANTAPSSDDGGSNVGIIVGAVVAGVVVVVAVAIFVWQRTKPPPPPPYEFDEEDKPGSMKTFNKTSIPVAITESTDSEGVQSPTGASWSSPNNRTDEGMEVVALSTPSKKSRKRGIIDLRRPGRNANGIEVSIEETKPPPRAFRDDADADSTFDFSMEVRSVASNADESMAGYSLAADLPERLAVIGKPVTPPRPTTTTTEAKPRAASPEIQNNPQMRWFAQQVTARTHSFVSSSSSSSPVSSRGSTPSKATHDAVPDPLRDSLTSEKKDTEVYMDDDDEEVEVVSRASSSYKEDDSDRGSSSVMSGISDNEFVGTHAQNENALGFFYREHDEPNEDFDILPIRTPQPVHSIPDDLSDVPSDERYGNYKAEQDLSGFARAQNIASEMDEINSSMESEYQSIVSPSVVSGEESPESMEAWARERRRIKRVARNRRQERKQPPLTMEV